MYFGKISPLSVRSRVWRILGGEKRGKHPTYTEETISGGLDFLFENLAEGECARVAIGCRLSEYCNGTDSVAATMSFDREKALIESLAGEREVEVVDMIGEHPELDVALRQCEKDESTGRIIPTEVLSNCELPANIDSNITALQIAKILYVGAMECPLLLTDLKSLPADELKTKRTSAQNELDSIDMYGLFEIAIRITDMLRGRVYQGGIDRQSKYDNVINRLLKEGGDFYSQSATLKPLLDFLRGRQFGAMYINRDKNFHERKSVQMRARIRTAIFATLGLGAVAVGAEGIENTADYLHERAEEQSRAEEREKIIATYEQELDYTCRQVDLWSVKNANVILGEYVFDKIEKELTHRYGLDRETSRLIAIQIIQELGKKNGNWNVCDIYADYSVLTRVIDAYLAEGNLFASLNGGEVRHPYQGFSQYYGLISATAKDPDCRISEEQDTELNPKGEMVKLGTYNQALEYETDYVETDFYVAGDGLLLATEPVYKPTSYKDDAGRVIGTYEKVGDRLSRNRACKLAPMFVSDMRRYDADIVNAETRERILDLLRRDVAEISNMTQPNFCIDRGMSPFTAFNGEFSFKTGWAYYELDNPNNETFTADCSIQTGLEASCYYLRNTTERYDDSDFEHFVTHNKLDPDTIDYCVTSSQAFANSSRTFDAPSQRVRN